MIHALFSLSSGRKIYSIRAAEAGHLLEFWSDNQDKEMKCEQKKNEESERPVNENQKENQQKE